MNLPNCSSRTQFSQRKNVLLTLVFTNFSVEELEFVFRHVWFQNWLAAWLTDTIAPCDIVGGVGHITVGLTCGRVFGGRGSVVRASTFRSGHPGFDLQAGQGNGQTFCPSESTLVQTCLCLTPLQATDGYGICNIRTNLGACRTQEGGSGTNKTAQVLSRRDRKIVPHPAPPGDRTQDLRL